MGVVLPALLYQFSIGAGIFNHQHYAGLVIVIALTTLLGPFAMQRFYARLGGCLPLRED